MAKLDFRFDHYGRTVAVNYRLWCVEGRLEIWNIKPVMFRSLLSDGVSLVLAQKSLYRPGRTLVCLYKPGWYYFSKGVVTEEFLRSFAPKTRHSWLTEGF